MIKINDKLVNEVSGQAKESPRKRKNYNFHKNSSDRLQRMLNAMEPVTYTRPHKHENPDKNEAFIILRGKIAAVQYDDKGQVTDFAILSPSGETKGVEIPPKTWHSFISLEEGSCLYEVKDGPYDPKTDKVFAPWAPEEGDVSAQEFNRQVLKKIGLR